MAKSVKPTEDVIDKHALIKFEEWIVKPVYQKVFNKKLRVHEDDLTGYTKEKFVKTSHIDQEHADTLNSQTPNSMRYYYTDGQEDFVPIESFYNL